MSKIVNITSKEDKDQKLQDIANSLQELKDVMAEVIEAYEEDNADSRKMDTLTEALDAYPFFDCLHCLLHMQTVEKWIR